MYLEQVKSEFSEASDACMGVKRSVSWMDKVSRSRNNQYDSEVVACQGFESCIRSTWMHKPREATVPILSRKWLSCLAYISRLASKPRL